MQDLTTFLDAQLEYFKVAYEILESVKKDWVERFASSLFFHKKKNFYLFCLFIFFSLIYLILSN